MTKIDLGAIIYDELQRRLLELRQLQNLISDIQDALGTAEEGEALVEVARNAHKAEQQLAYRKRIDRHTSS